MDRAIKAITTHYAGKRFRSRLEAKWAVAFAVAGIEWDYEIEGFDLGKNGLYLPDFWIPCPIYGGPEAGYWVEIKPTGPNDIERAKALALTEMTGHTTHIFWNAFREEDLLYRSFHAKRNPETNEVTSVKESGTGIKSHLPEFFSRKIEEIKQNNNAYNWWLHFTCFFWGQHDEDFESAQLGGALIAAGSARFEFNEFNLRYPRFYPGQRYPGPQRAT